MNIEKIKRRNSFISKAKYEEYRMDEQFQNFLIFEILIVF